MPSGNHRQHTIHPLSSAGRLGSCSVAALTGFLASSAAGATDRDIRHIGACVPVPTRSAWTVPLDDPDARTALDHRAVLVCDTPDGGWRAAAGSPMPTASILAVAADVSRWVEFLPYVTASAGGGAVDGPSTGTFTLEVRGHSASQTLHQGPSARGLGFTVVGDPGSPLRRAVGHWYTEPDAPGVIFCALDAQARWWTPGFLLHDLGRSGLGRLVWEVRRRAEQS